MVSLYYNTKTKDSFDNAKMGVLQLLAPSQKNLVPVLGKRSGYEEGYDKSAACAKEGFPWVDASSLVLDASSRMDLLPECVSYIQLQWLSSTPAGDHEVALCEVVSTGVWDAEQQRVVTSAETSTPLDQDTVLYTGLLRSEGII